MEMELDDHGFLEELLALRRDTWDASSSFPMGISELFPPADQVGFESYYQDASTMSLIQPSLVAQPTTEPSFDCLSEVYCPYPSGLTASALPELQSSSNEVGSFHDGEGQSVFKAEAPVVASGGDQRKKKRVEGMPSKNLMAERRRRKRLNDRLSMLRSVVPKISKMDRTSILGDTIDYMKELLERIRRLQEEMDLGSDQGSLLRVFKEFGPNEIMIRNSPKFDVERRVLGDIRVEICCAAKPGLLLSTVSTLEALGLEIQHCVVSCFNDFAMQASCTEELEQRGGMSCDEMKQALFRNAGYGGRCM